MRKLLLILFISAITMTSCYQQTHVNCTIRVCYINGDCEDLYYKDIEDNELYLSEDGVLEIKGTWQVIATNVRRYTYTATKITSK